MPADPSPAPTSDDAATIAALIDSRERWRDLARAAFDLTFETDGEGRFVLLGPGEAFGWPTRHLLGQPAETLLVQPAGTAGFNPFLPQAPVRRHRTWFRCADGSAVNVLVSSSPLRDRQGRLVGARGAVQDISEQETRDEHLAETLLRRQTVKEIDRRMRRAVLPDMVVKIGLEQLLDATGGAGAILVTGDPSATPARGQPTGSSPRILQRAGGAPPAADAELTAHVIRATAAMPAPWTLTTQQFGCRLIMTASATHFCDPVVLMLWRDDQRDWLAGDADLAAAVLATLGGVLEHDQVQRELARRSGADTLTGLLNRDSFALEIERRLDRLDAEGLAATLMVVGLDRFREINESRGHETGDEVLRQASHILRDTVRPTDLVARLGNDVFALWLDGADQFAAAERAEAMCQRGVPVMLDEALQLRVSVGLSTRPSRSDETIDSLLEQAHAALGAIKLAGGGRWHFYNEGVGT